MNIFISACGLIAQIIGVIAIVNWLWTHRHQITNKASNLVQEVKTPFVTAEQVEWIVNDSGELGVKIGTNCYFLYKGSSLMYLEGTHDDGSPMMYRTVGKREFGECCHPFTKPHVGDCDRWRPLPIGSVEARGY